MTDELKELLSVDTAEAAEANQEVLEEKVEAYEQVLAYNREHRRQALLENDEARLAELQAQIGEGELAIERMALIRTALEEKAAELREQKRIAKDRATFEEGKKAAQRAQELVKKFDALAPQLVELVGEINRLAEINRRARKVAHANGWDEDHALSKALPEFPYGTPMRDLVKDVYRSWRDYLATRKRMHQQFNSTLAWTPEVHSADGEEAA